MNTAPALVCRGVVKRFGANTVLDALDLEVAHGDTVGLVGVNGAGKSTFMKTALDLCALDAGAIELYGIGHRDVRARRRCAYLTENFHPPHFAAGIDYLTFLARLHGVEPDARAVAAECAALDLDPAVLRRPARHYSKGMRQKLGLIACILATRDLLLLDEPLSGLDPGARALFRRRLLDLKRAGTTVLFSTHLLDDLDAICDRVIVLDGGRNRFSGTVAAFREQFPAESLEGSFLRCIDAVSAA